MRKLIPTSWLAGRSLKARLFTIMAILGLVPVAGVVVALIALNGARQDQAALDRAARDTIHLEHINGLVYAVVMELRGIYMSADWKSAEPFARKLLQGLTELQETVEAWKVDAIAAQRSNVEELAKRLGDFVRFRVELVRLGKEESTAAARAFGDNDANRNVRTSLNESLARPSHEAHPLTLGLSMSHGGSTSAMIHRHRWERRVQTRQCSFV